MNIKQVLHHLNRRDTRLLPKNITLVKLISISLIIFSTIFLTKTILAVNQESTNPVESLIQYKESRDKGGNLESWQNSNTNNIIYNAFTLINGDEAIDSLKENQDKIATGSSSTTYKTSGIMGITTNVIASTFTPAASGVEYVAQLKNDFFGKPAYAATGFEGLTNIMGLWKTFRNVVYVLTSLVFIILGIMIMLRIKVSPQAVVTLQNSIPKVITTLILVTFSYAIAGFLIDIINLLQALAISLIFSGSGKNLSDNLFPMSWSDWSLTNLINAIKSVFGVNAFNFEHLNSGNFWMVLALTQRLAPNVITTLLGAIVGGIIGTIINPGAGTLIGGAAGGILFSVIIGIILIIYLIKFAINLTKCYITALLKIILGPLEIFLGVFPNSKIGFSTWITDLIANLVAFPVCLLFLIIVNLICDSVFGNLWAPHLVQGPVTWFLPIIIGIASIAMVSQLPTLIPEFIFKIKPSPFGKAIGEGLKIIPGAGIGGLVGKGVGAVAPYAASKGVNKLYKEYGVSMSEDDKTSTDRPGGTAKAVRVLHDVFDFNNKKK